MIKCKLSPLALGLAFGVIWGLSVLITGLTALYFSYGTPFIMAMNGIYIGYEPSIAGSFLGGLFGFIHGLVGGAILGCLYNCFATKCCCHASQEDQEESCNIPAHVAKKPAATAPKKAATKKPAAAIKKPKK